MVIFAFRFVGEYKEMNAIILLLPLLLLVTPGVTHGQQATVAAPPGSKIGPITVTPLEDLLKVSCACLFSFLHLRNLRTVIIIMRISCTTVHEVRYLITQA